LLKAARDKPFLLNTVLLLCFALATVLLFAGGPGAYALRSTMELWNLGHILYFALMVLLFSRWAYFGQISLRRQWLLLLGISLAWGAGIEILQAGIGRDADVMDVSRDLCGSWLMLCFHPVYSSQINKNWRQVLRFSAVVALIGHLIPSSIALTDEAIARRQFPVLSDFSTPFELDRWQGNASFETVTGFAGKAGNQMKINLRQTRYPGLGLKYLPPDWSGYRFVKLDIYSPYASAQQITVRIHDWIHQTRQPTFQLNDRFNKRFSLLKGWNTLTIDLSEVAQAPRTRKMDMTHIADISFFMMSPDRPKTLYLDQVYLTR
jgi:hypothetical protein